VASIREASKVQLLVSNTEVKAAKELHLETRLAQLRDDKRRIRREFNELKFAGSPSEARQQCYNEEIKDLDDEINTITLKLGSLSDPNSTHE